jgi:hypothetical protein
MSFKLTNFTSKVDVNPEKAIFELGLDECSNLVKAYEAMHETFVSVCFSLFAIR